MTVLIGLVAASITLVIVRASLDDARVTASRRAYDLAYGTARAEADKIVRALNANPASLLSEVSENEPSRICVAVDDDGEPLTVDAGDAWPAACGTYWTYPSTIDGTKVWVRLPEPDSPNLRVRAVAEVAGTRAGVELQLRAGNRTASLTSESNLDLATLAGGGAETTLKGLIYTTGTLTVPESGLDLSGATLAAESSVTGLDSQAPLHFAGSGFDANTNDIRDLFPVPNQRGGLRAKVAELRSFACPGTSLSATANVGSLCLIAGGRYVASNGNVVNAPETVSSWLLLPGAGGTGTIDVFTQTTGVDLVGECPQNQPNCSLASVALSSPSHPSLLGSWDLLGSFKLPLSGLLATDTTTHLGLCGENFASPGSSCATISGTQPGTLIEEDLTVIVGSVSRPADLYLSGPLQTNTSRLSLVTSGDLILPYWQRPVGGNYQVPADVIVLGRSIDAPVRTFPSTSLTGTNQGGNLTFTGSLAVTRAAFDIESYDTFKLQMSQQVRPGPWWSTAPGWTLDRARRLAVAEIAAPWNF